MIFKAIHHDYLRCALAYYDTRGITIGLERTIGHS